MKLGVYTRYARLGASSRYRYYGYAEAFREAGIQAEFHPLLPDEYLRKLYAGEGKSTMLAGLALLRRLAGTLLATPKRMLIEYELFPGLPWSLERRFLSHRGYVLNFDDNVWEKYNGNPRLENKYDELVRHSAGVIVANDFLLEKVRPLQPEVIKIPTAVDLESFRKNRAEKFPRFTLVWIGTPVTYAYLEQFSGTLRAMAAAVDFELLVLARKSLESRRIAGVNMRFLDWSSDSEMELLSRSHVGIMPLPSGDRFALGKSAFKLIQYQAAGIPAIASPVGENSNVIHSGKNGFTAVESSEWVQALRQLAENPDRREAFAQQADLDAEQYSIRKFAPIYCDFLKRRLSERDDVTGK